MRLHKTFSLSLIFILLFTHHIVKGQDTSNTIGRVSIASPNAASLGKYGDIPVSYFTGIPNINIPIYTVKSGSLEMPISLSYHAGGLKVQEQASWVGAGWTLNAGGVITRTVVGAPDDRGNNTISNDNVTNGYYSDYGFQSYISPSTSGDDMNFVRGYKDGEPDLYFFNFGGYSGKFYFNDDRTVVLLPKADFKIEPTLQIGPGFTGFVITTSDGVKYYFGQTGNNGSVNPIETTLPYNVETGASNPATSSWYLNKIISADGVDSILFNYQQENMGTYTLAFSPVLNSNYYPNDPTKNGINAIKNIINGVRLSSIVTPTGTVTFGPTSWARSDLSSGSTIQMADAANTNAFALDNITISGATGFCKKFNFYYGYFYDPTPLNNAYFSGYTVYNIQSDQYRLRLDSIRESSCDSSIVKPAYKFSYFSESVPRKLSFGIDHWGYSNGVTTNSNIAGLVPTYIITDNTGNSTVNNGANRDAAWPAMRGGALQQITYPTGGYTTFDYEPKDQGNYTNTIYTYSNTSIASLTVRMYGQSAYSNSMSFSCNNNQITANVNNSSNYAASLVITDSYGSIVYSNYNIPNANGSTPYTGTIPITLSAGTYTMTISLPNYSNLTGGFSANLTQWQSVPTTTNQTLLVGGLRIKTITSNDGITSNNVVTSYDYKAGGSVSTGFLYSRPTYIQILRNDIMALVWPYDSPNGCASKDGFNGHSYFLTPGSVQPMQNAQGENEGFGEVDVIQSGNGKTIYQYYGSSPWSNSNSDVCVRSITQSSVCDNTIPNYPSAPVPYDFMRGELKYDAAYNQSGQVIKENYHFPVYTTDPLITPGHIATNLPGMYTYTEYNLQTSKKVSDSTVTNIYDPSTGNYETIKQATYYGSAYHTMPTLKNTYSSKGELISSSIKYSFDLRGGSCDGTSDGTATYTSAVNADNSWLSNNINTCSPQVNDATNCKWSVYTQYRLNIQQDRINFINYRRTNFTDPGNNYYNCFQSALSSADATLKPVLQLQNEYVNVPIETSSWKNGALLQSHYTNYGFINGYVYPVSDQLVNLSSPSTTFSPATVSGSSILLDGRYLVENIVNYSQGRVADVTTKAGVTTAYIWGYGNQYPVAKISGANYATASSLVNPSQSTISNMSTTDANMRAALSSLRSGLPSALVNTYTYTPMLGMTSQTDARGYLSTFEYDALGRLLRTRDMDGNIIKQNAYTYAANTGSVASPPPGFNMTVNDNNSTYTGYTVSLTAVSGGNSQSFVINSLGYNSMGPVVPGVYNIVITPPPSNTGGLMAILSISGSSSLYSSGSIATFSNITLGASNYNTINIY
ncbi:MAG: RHS repeat protein [Bacteroidota bacterium]|nr:RHS repeat protein [Bacteroidota bacterium]